jgi:hypothetical protein
VPVYSREEPCRTLRRFDGVTVVREFVKAAMRDSKKKPRFESVPCNDVMASSSLIRRIFQDQKAPFDRLNDKVCVIPWTRHTDNPW